MDRITSLIFCYVLLLLSAPILWGQDFSNYQPLQSDTKEGLAIVEQKQQQWMGHINKNQDILEEAYANRYEYLIYGFDEHHFLYGSAIQPYLDSILAIICEANTDIPQKDLFVILTRYATPNAVSMGDGTILFNIGLLRKLENESQLAWVLCHEIAHYTLAHLEQSVSRYESTYADKNLKKETKRSMRKGQYQKAMGILENVIYNQRRQNRAQETQADSLGMYYFANTAYNMEQGIKSLELLEHIDEEKYQEEIDLKALFHSQQYPFKERWLKQDAIMFDGHTFVEEQNTYFNQDSIRTHPECAERINSLNIYFQEGLASPSGTNYLLDSTTFQQWTTQADFELVEGLYHFEAYGYALYQCINMLGTYPQSAYLHAMIGRCLLQIHQAMEAHELEEVVPLPKNEFDEEFRKLCAFIHKLRPRELAAVNYHYLNHKKELFGSDEALSAVWAAAESLYTR